MHQIVFRLDPISGAYSAPPYPLAGLGVGPVEREGGRGRGKGGKGGDGGQERGGSPGMPTSRVGKPKTGRRLKTQNKTLTEPKSALLGNNTQLCMAEEGTSQIRAPEMKRY